MGPYVSWNDLDKAWSPHIYIVRKGKIEEVLRLQSWPSNTEAVDHLINFLEQ